MIKLIIKHFRYFETIYLFFLNLRIFKINITLYSDISYFKEISKMYLLY